MQVFLNDQIYISGEQWIPESVEEIQATINSLLDTVHCLNFYPNFLACYSGNGITQLINNFQAIEELTDYSLSNPIHQLRQLLREVSSFNWDDNPRQKNDHLYFYQTNLGATVHTVNKTTVAESVEYKFEGNLVVLLNLSVSDFSTANPIHINRSKITPPETMNIVPVNTANEKTQLISQLKQSDIKREYHWIKKHGESGLGVQNNKGEEVSPLLCSRKEAEEIFETAVGFYKTNEMYAFDTKHEKFVVFKSEGDITPKQYHAYHPIDQSEVPEEVQSFLLSLI